MNADTPFHAAFAGNPGIVLRCQSLQCDRTFNRTDHRAELDQHPVAGGLDQPPAMSSDNRVARSAMLAERLRRACLVEPHQPRIACDIGCEDRRETAGLAHVSSPAAKRRPDRNSSRSFGLRKGTSLGTTRAVMARSRATTARASSSLPIWA